MDKFQMNFVTCTKQTSISVISTWICDFFRINRNDFNTVRFCSCRNYFSLKQLSPTHTMLIESNRGGISNSKWKRQHRSLLENLPSFSRRSMLTDFFRSFRTACVRKLCQMKFVRCNLPISIDFYYITCSLMLLYYFYYLTIRQLKDYNIIEHTVGQHTFVVEKMEKEL